MPAAREQVISCDHGIFTHNFNRLPHEVQHTLANNSLFQLSALAELSQRVANRKNPHHSKGDIYYDLGTDDGDSKTEALDPKKEIANVIRDIEKGKTWIILKHIEREPGYREIFEDCICDILNLTDKNIIKTIKWFEAILFITSPNRVTEYHIDRECSWLLQIQGKKDIHFFDRADKDVLPDDELERYWAIDNLSAVYKPQFESRAIVFNMQPGTGVHSPVNTPHWLKNANNVSVSLNINFQFHESNWENLFKANYYLRRAGLTPTSPGKSPLRDGVKSRAYSAAQTIRRSFKGLPSFPTNEARQEYHRIVDLLASR
ncbi:MAG TPA: hypothetical protein VNU92_17480 [Edaphobacter sp.]|nr:hypothetical protein [Edaphobacter sp.]